MIKFSKEHEWVKIVDGTAYIGISDYAQNALGDIVYVDLPEEGANVVAGDPLGAVESVKAVTDLYSPISGIIVKVNQALSDSPELLNADPYENWVVGLEPTDLAELDVLMEEQEYNKYCETL